MLRRTLLIAMVSALVLLSNPAHVSSQDGSSLLVTSISADNFPEVELAIRVVDANRRALGGLTREQFTLYENGVPVEDFQVEERDDSPMVVIFVIDLGRYSNYDNFGQDTIRAALSALVDGGTFRDGQDMVEIRARIHNTGAEETAILLPATQSAIEFTGFVSTMSLDRGFGSTQALVGVEEAIERMGELAQPGQASTAIVLLTPVVDTLRSVEAVEYARGVAAAAVEQSIPVYALHSHLGGEFTEPLETVANGSGGEYLRLLQGVDQSDELARLYSRIAAQRTSYAATYRTTSGAAGPREVVVAYEGPAGQASGTATYEVMLQPPTVSVVEPAGSGALELSIEQAVDGEQTVITASIPVVAELGSWADGHPRGIVEVELVVNGRSAEQVTPTPGATQFTFSWDIPPVEPGDPTPVTFVVRVRDELGLTAESPQVTLNVSVTEVQQPGFFDACLADPLSFPCSVVFVLPVILVVGLLAAVLVVVIGRQSRARQASAVPGGGSFFETLVAADEVTRAHGLQAKGPEAGGPQPLATLCVIEGPADMKGRVFPIQSEMTKIGRNPDMTDITFYSEERSSVSSLHCTLQVFRGMFFLTDNNSRNGTSVNGQPLIPGRPCTLGDGDRIVLGDLALKGVELAFTLGGMLDTQTPGATLLEVPGGEPEPAGPAATLLELGYGDRTILEAGDPDEHGEGPGNGRAV